MDKAICNALTAFEQTAGLEPDAPPSTRLWHMLVSLLTWCDVQTPRIDFDATLEEARQYLAETALRV